MTQAKTRTSEPFRRTRAGRPQRVTKRDDETIAIVPAADFERSAERARQPAAPMEFFRSAPTGACPSRPRPECAGIYVRGDLPTCGAMTVARSRYVRRRNPDAPYGHERQGKHDGYRATRHDQVADPGLLI